MSEQNVVSMKTGFWPVAVIGVSPAPRLALDSKLELSKYQQNEVISSGIYYQQNIKQTFSKNYKTVTGMGESVNRVENLEREKGVGYRFLCLCLLFFLLIRGGEIGSHSEKRHGTISMSLFLPQNKRGTSIILNLKKQSHKSTGRK